MSSNIYEQVRTEVPKEITIEPLIELLILIVNDSQWYRYFVPEEFCYHLKTTKVYGTYLVVNELQKKFPI